MEIKDTNLKKTKLVLDLIKSIYNNSISNIIEEPPITLLSNVNLDKITILIRTMTTLNQILKL